MESTQNYQDISLNNTKLIDRLILTTNLLDESPRVGVFSKTSPDKISLRPSALNKSYQTYNPVHQSILRSTKRYEPLDRRPRNHSEGMPLSVNPLQTSFKVHKVGPISRVLSDQSSVPVESMQKPLQVHGRRANISLPKIGSNSSPSGSPIVDKLKNFTKEVEAKYEDLYCQLSTDKNVILKENVVEYLKNKTVGKNEHVSPEVFTCALSIMNIFDPFSTGVITHQLFFGILAMYEYSLYGLHRPRLPMIKIDIANTQHLLTLKTQVHKLKNVFCQYSDGKTMKKEEFLKVIESISGGAANEIYHFVNIGPSVTFGQFLSTLPYLLEKYDALN